MIGLLRAIGDRDFSSREQELLQFLHGELGPLIGRSLVSALEPGPEGLSPRLRQTLACLLEGDSEKQVAARLGLSQATVHQYVTALYRPFGVRSRTVLTLHLLGVIVWLGAGLYELFLDHEIKRARGTPAEVALARVYVRYGPVVAAATLAVAPTGVLQASLFGWGYFGVVWLGAKQLLMLLVLAILGALLPTFVRMGRAVTAHPADARQLSDEARSLFERIRPHVLVMRAAALLAVLLAIFRPGASVA